MEGHLFSARAIFLFPALVALFTVVPAGHAAAQSPIAVSGSIVVVTGTAGPDKLHLTLGSGGQLKLNELAPVTLPVTIQRIIFGGSGGEDLVLVSSSGRPREFDIDSRRLRIASSGERTVYLYYRDVETVTVRGGTPSDGVIFYDTNERDLFVGRPEFAELRQLTANNAPRLQAESFRRVSAYSSSGQKDIALLYDSSEDDYYLGQRGHAGLYGDNFSLFISSFRSSYAYSLAGGRDTARFYDDLSPACAGVVCKAGSGVRYLSHGFQVHRRGGRRPQPYQLPRRIARGTAEIEQYLSQIKSELDIDRTPDRFADAVLLLRYMVGLRGPELTRDLPYAQYDLEQLESRLEELTMSLILDVDGDGKSSFSDGLLAIRFEGGARGAELVNGILPAGRRETSQAVGAYLSMLRDLRVLDINSDGYIDPYIDGTRVLRYVAGIRGPQLMSDLYPDGEGDFDLQRMESYLKALSESAVLDIDGDGKITITDGLLIFRFLSSPDADLLNDIVLPSRRSEPNARRAYFDLIRNLRLLDINGDHSVDPYFDGSLILNYLAGLRGADLLGDLSYRRLTPPTAEEVETILGALAGSGGVGH